MKLFRKIATVFAAAALMVSVAGNAMAYFEQGHLVRVVYDLSKSIEVATDLGDVNTIINASGSNIYGSGSNSYLTGALATSDLSNLFVSYFATVITPNDLWLSSSNATQNATITAWTATKSAMNSVLNTYKAKGTQTVESPTTNLSGYWYKLDGNGTKAGSFNNTIQVGAGEMSLATLSSSDSVDLNLFFWDNPGTISTGEFKIVISTLADGSTRVSAVPIPPAFFLMGSGLLGMIGLRRRMA